MIANTQRRIVKTWYIIALIFLIGIFVPSWIGPKGMDGGFAISFMAGFMVLAGVIVIFVYRSRAKKLDRILNGEGRIALWRYSPEEWMRFVSIDFEEEKKLKKKLFLLVAGISSVIGIILVLIVKNNIILPIIAGILLIVAVPAFLAPRLRNRKLLHSEAEVLISEDGIIVGKMFHLWKGLRTRLDMVSLEKNSDPAILSFHYSMPSRNGRQEETARVPVPSGKLGEAREIVIHFTEQTHS